MRKPRISGYPLLHRCAIVLAFLVLSAAAVDAAHGDSHPGQVALISAPAAAAQKSCLWLQFLKRCLDVHRATAEDTSVSFPSQQPHDERNFDGLKRDAYYILGLQVVIIGVLYVMPEELSGWSEEQKEERQFDEWWDHVNNPTWDEDKDWINYVAHPYWGAAYYVRAREHGYSKRQAFWYSCLLSTMYEFGLEAVFEPVSIQDFFVTPIVGSWVGGYFVKWRDRTRERIDRTGEVRFRDKALLNATDPIGAINGFIDRRLGRDIEFQATPFITRRPTSQSLNRHHRRKDSETTYGIVMTLRW